MEQNASRVACVPGQQTATYGCDNHASTVFDTDCVRYDTQEQDAVVASFHMHKSEKYVDDINFLIIIFLLLRDYSFFLFGQKAHTRCRFSFTECMQARKRRTGCNPKCTDLHFPS